MKKRILALVLVIVTLLSTNVFAYRWVEDNGVWYVYDDETGKQIKNTLVDVGNGVYYLDKNGAMVVGWWKHPETKKYYFFDNNVDRNYGNMTFGLHMIDGYYRFFGENGELATSDEEGSYKNVFADFWADSKGNIYYANELMRDVTTGKSEFYTNAVYYTNNDLNNYFLATFDNPVEIKASNENETVELVSDGNSSIITVHANLEEKGRRGEIKEEAKVTGGTDYYIDEAGHLNMSGHVEEISDLEKYGPRSMVN